MQPERSVTNDCRKIIERDGDGGCDGDEDDCGWMVNGTHAATLGRVRLSTDLDFAILITLLSSHLPHAALYQHTLRIPR